MAIIERVLSLIIGLTLVSCSPSLNKQMGSTWSDNTTKKRMNYIVQEILIEELKNDSVYLCDTLQLRDSENQIPLVAYGDTYPERHFRFEKPGMGLNEYIRLNLKSKVKKKTKLISLEQIEKEGNYFVWYYISPVIEIKDFNKKYYSFDIEEYDSFVQIIINMKIPGTNEILKEKPNYIYVSNLYIFKSDDKGEFLEHHLVWEGG